MNAVRIGNTTIVKTTNGYTVYLCCGLSECHAPPPLKNTYVFETFDEAVRFAIEGF